MDGGRMFRSLVALGVLAVASASFAATGAAAERRVKLTGRWSDPPDDFTYAVPGCDPSGPPPGCRIVNTGHSAYTGDWAGGSVWQNGLSVVRNVIYLRGIETFTGSVRGCGAGTMTWSMNLTIASGRGRGTFAVIPELGTGGLRGVAGSGTLKLRFRGDTSNYGIQRGVLRCSPRARLG
jgi:hypothetical protein